MSEERVIRRGKLESPKGTARKYNVIELHYLVPECWPPAWHKTPGKTSECASRHSEECIWRFPIGRGFRMLGIRNSGRAFYGSCDCSASSRGLQPLERSLRRASQHAEGSRRNRSSGHGLGG